MARRIIAALLPIFLCLSLLLSSCADMGAVASEEEFKKCFSQVVLLGREGREVMDIASFSAFDNDEDGIPEVVEPKEYCYIAFKVAEGYTLTVSEFAAFMWSDISESVDLSLEFFVAAKIPTKLVSLDGKEYIYLPDEYGEMPETDEDGNYIDRENEVDEEYITKESEPVGDAIVSVSSKRDSFHTEFGKDARLYPSDYLVIKVKNNCQTYSEEGLTPPNTSYLSFNYLLFYFEEVISPSE